ncbi:hypothetical protein [Nocardia carnea]|uniref:hypothetical protein n=1 Tax=Nocardia carnea TaxID=37328 RepID=UPI0024553ED4|nr:hypothetical protein [Nocardia carnea]
MIRYEVHNYDEQDRQWQVEPYGDRVTLKPHETMTVDFEHATDVVIEVSLFSEGLSELWVHADLEHETQLFPDHLKRDGVSVWPEANR